MSGRKVMVQPINILFSFLQKHTRVQIWLYDNNEFRMEAFIIVRGEGGSLTTGIRRVYERRVGRGRGGVRLLGKARP